MSELQTGTLFCGLILRKYPNETLKKKSGGVCARFQNFFHHYIYSNKIDNRSNMEPLLTSFCNAIIRASTSSTVLNNLVEILPFLAKW